MDNAVEGGLSKFEVDVYWLDLDLRLNQLFDLAGTVLRSSFLTHAEGDPLFPSNGASKSRSSSSKDTSIPLGRTEDRSGAVLGDDEVEKYGVRGVRLCPAAMRSVRETEAGGAEASAVIVIRL